MVESLFRNWKSAALLAVGISTLAAAFFAEGGGHESLEQSAEQIRERRTGADAGQVVNVSPGPVITPVPSDPNAAPGAASTEEAEPAFGAPMDGEETPTPAATKPAPAKPQDGEGSEEQFQQEQAS